MGFVKRFTPNDGGYFKIRHYSQKGFETIGRMISIKEELNICKVLFKDLQGKERRYWFNMFTGKCVALPKKGEEWAKTYANNHDKAYFLTLDPVHLYDIDPSMDINFQGKKIKKEEELEEPKEIVVENQNGDFSVRSSKITKIN